jgi:hypothetical protein
MHVGCILKKESSLMRIAVGHTLKGEDMTLKNLFGVINYMLEKIFVIKKINSS